MEISQNTLPYDGTVTYFGPILDQHQADDFFQRLIGLILWQRDEITIYGKKYVTARKTAWYGEPGLDYTYSGNKRTPLPWTQDLLTLKSLVEDLSGETYNSCLLNLYHDGSEGMSWHTDDEKMLKKKRRDRVTQPGRRTQIFLQTQTNKRNRVCIIGTRQPSGYERCHATTLASCVTQIPENKKSEGESHLSDCCKSQVIPDQAPVSVVGWSSADEWLLKLSYQRLPCAS